MNEKEKQLSQYLLNPHLEHQLEDLLNSDSLDITQIIRLIESGVDVNTRFEDDTPAIALAASTGNLDVVKALIEAGADVNAYGEIGEFALGAAAGNGWQEVYDYLLSLTKPRLRKEAKIHLPEGKKSQQYRDRENDQTQVQMKIEFANACFSGNLDLVKSLIGKGYQIDTPDLEGNTPLYRAAFCQAPTSVQTLLEVGASPNVQCDRGWTPLKIAISMPPLLNDGTDQKKILKLLIDGGADVNLRSDNGKTALMEIVDNGASSQHIKELIDQLLAAGADTEIEDKYGNTAILIAASCKKQDIVDYLKLLGAYDQNLKQIQLILAAKSGDIHAVKQIIQNGININSQDHVGKTALIYASMQGYTDIVNALIEAGIDLNIQDGTCQSALLWAIEKWHFTIATTLVNAGANTNLVNRQGYNALTLAKSFLPSKDPELRKFIKFLREKDKISTQKKWK